MIHEETVRNPLGGRYLVYSLGISAQTSPLPLSVIDLSFFSFASSSFFNFSCPLSPASPLLLASSPLFSSFLSSSDRDLVKPRVSYSIVPKVSFAF